MYSPGKGVLINGKIVVIELLVVVETSPTSNKLLICPGSPGVIGGV